MSHCVLFQDPFNISDGVDGSAMFYTVTYTDTVSNSSCHSATLPASNCIGGVCYNNYSIQSSSVDSFTACSIHSPSIAVRVSAGNVLGNSSESMPIYISIGGFTIIFGIHLHALPSMQYQIQPRLTIARIVRILNIFHCYYMTMCAYGVLFLSNHFRQCICWNYNHHHTCHHHDSDCSS